MIQKWFATGEAISHLRYLEEEGRREKIEVGRDRRAPPRRQGGWGEGKRKPKNLLPIGLMNGTNELNRSRIFISTRKVSPPVV